MAGIFIVIGMEIILFWAFLNRKTKVGRKITVYLMKRQGIKKVWTVREVDERIDEIIEE